MSNFVQEEVIFLDGWLKVTLETNPNHGHVAFAVWPCSAFLVDCLVGIRVLEKSEGSFSFDGVGAPERVRRWQALEAAAKRFLMDRSRSDTLLSQCRIVELGSGTGVVGIALHKLGARNTILTDMTKCMTILERNLEHWRKTHQCKGHAIHIAPLTWESYKNGDLSALVSSLEQLDVESTMQDKVAETSDIEMVVDVLVACDCVYGTAHIGTSPMLPILSDFFCVSAGGSTRKVAFIAYECRDEDIESSFWYQVGKLPSVGVTLLGEQKANPSEGNELETTSYCLFMLERTV